MERPQPNNLKLVVNQPSQISRGQSREFVFGIDGGSIGSADSDTWRLSSHRTGASQGHAEIRYVDGEFCLIDRSGRTYINSGSQPVGRGRRARLKSGDVIRIGAYHLRAEVMSPTETGTEWNEVSEDTSLVDSQEGTLVKPKTDSRDTHSEEPITALRPAPGHVVSDDPMTAWEPEGRDTAVALPLQTGRKREKSRGNEGSEVGRGDEASRQHISGAPLLKGLDSDLAMNNSEDMRLFLEEAGQTLKATVDGLLALHRGEDSRHQALRMRLQPIEDNPLRLGGNYRDTVQTLFAHHRSPVHLSAPAAVRESLQSLNHHQQATQVAISEALEAILHAFSPRALLQRFHGYRRGLQAHEQESSWAWEMYKHYYEELSSSRQQGFERLFQEVFEQAYDQHLRQLQRETLS